MQEQFDAEGRLRHLITLENFDRARLTSLLDKASERSIQVAKDNCKGAVAIQLVV